MAGQKIFQHKETKTYLAVWISAVLYATYHFMVTSQKYFQNFHDSYDDFSPGWSILASHRRDRADFEWETIIFYLSTFYPVIILYIVISEAIRYFQLETKHQQYFQTLFPILYLTQYMGYKVALITFFQPIVFSLVSVFSSTVLVWMCNLLCLAFIAFYKQMNTSEQFLKLLGINHFESYLSILLLCWMNLKCTSYFLSVNTVSKRRLLDFDFFSYCFYLPTLLTGPFIPYKDFKRMYYMKEFENFNARLQRLGMNLSRCVFWFTFVNFSLHFAYVSATSFQTQLVQKLDLCTLCGYGYLMGQFFHIKYVVLYGLGTSLASFENIPVPSLPRCIGRVHLYSDMWKFFDPGLYSFLKMSIFIPCQNLGITKFASSFLCFFFVYIWHGIEEYILIWATLNFIGVALENIANGVYEKRLKNFWLVKNLSENDLRRVKCMLAAPLLAMSSVSNFYFFAGKEIGDIFAQKSLSESSLNKLVLLFMLYCCCNVSTEVRSIDAHRM